jgi:hypothetical protein
MDGDCAPVQALGRASLPYAVTEGLSWPAAIFRDADFSGRILHRSLKRPACGDLQYFKPSVEVLSRFSSRHREWSCRPVRLADARPSVPEFTKATCGAGTSKAGHE